MKLLERIDISVDVVVIIVSVVSISISVWLIYQYRQMRRATDLMNAFSLMKHLHGSHIRWYRERALRAERERDALQAALDAKAKER